MGTAGNVQKVVLINFVTEFAEPLSWIGQHSFHSCYCYRNEPYDHYWTGFVSVAWMVHVKLFALKGIWLTWYRGLAVSFTSSSPIASTTESWWLQHKQLPYFCTLLIHQSYTGRSWTHIFSLSVPTTCGRMAPYLSMNKLYIISVGQSSESLFSFPFTDYKMGSDHVTLLLWSLLGLLTHI